MAGNKVYVGDLADNVEEEEIKQAFQKIGEVTEVELKSTFAFVHMADSNDVDEAINKLHQTEIAGKVVRVEKPRPRRPRGRGMGGGGGFGGRSDACFNCGMPGHWQRECRRPPAGGGGYRGAYGGGGGGGGGFGGGGYGMAGYGGGMGGRGGPPQGSRGMMPYSDGGGAGAGGDRGGRGRGGFGGGPGGRGRGRGNCFRCNSPSHWSRECPQENQQGFQ